MTNVDLDLDAIRNRLPRPAGPDEGMTRTALFAEALKQMGYHPEALTGNLRPGSFIMDKMERPPNAAIVFEIAKREGLTNAESLDEFRHHHAFRSCNGAGAVNWRTSQQH